MIHPEIRPEGPSLFHIFLGMLKIMHLKQFIVIALSISILLLIFRVLSLYSFLFCLLVCGFLLLLLTFIDYLLKHYRLRQHQQQREEELVPLIDNNNSNIEDSRRTFKSHVRYDLKFYSKTEFPDVPDLCGVCLQTIPEGTEVAVLPCMHIFHPKCIEKWTKVNNSCPFCKATII